MGHIAENMILGLDLGIASIGWALIDSDAKRIVDCGVRTFDAPETDKEKTPGKQIRREKRLLRRVIRRRRQRMAQIRRICDAHLGPEAERSPRPLDPWAARAEGLDRRLSVEELRAALIHIAKHRGFQSNRKGGERNAVGEDQKALLAMSELAERLAAYRSFGEMMVMDEAFQSRKRNRPDDYGRTPKRDWLRDELAKLFERQRALGSSIATPDLENAFRDAAFHQRPLQDSESLVRSCPFEPGEKRSSKHAPSFERFRLLQKLAHLRLWTTGAPDRALTPDEIAAIERRFGGRVKLTYKTIRNALDLSPAVRFRGVLDKDENKDVATAAKEGSAPGMRALHDALGSELYASIGEAALDVAMFTIAFRETEASVEQGLRELKPPEQAVTRLMAAVADGAFLFATGAAHVSAKACRALLPGLRDGLVYSDACREAGYDHSSPGAEALAMVSRPASRQDLVAVFADPKLSPIASPVARKALIEGVKQITTLINAHPQLCGALPGAIHVELARDVGKGPKERQQIEAGIKRRRADIDKMQAAFEDSFGRSPRRGAAELRTFELAQEQEWKCAYTGHPIEPARLFDGVSYQIDHILPWSRFGDNSYVNLALCIAAANQAKRNRTPYEWFQQERDLNGAALDWSLFRTRIENLKIKGLKKRNYLLSNASEREEAFRERNLNDTRFAARLLLRAADLLFPDAPDEGARRRRLRARPGALTALMRRAWGVEGLKKVDGQRVDDDRPHALDAIILAATTESMVNRLTRAHQEAEEMGLARDFGETEPPWESFRDDVRDAIKNVFVSRAERRRARGQLHEETIRAIAPDETGTLARLTPAALLGAPCEGEDPDALREKLERRFPRPERSRAIINELMRWRVDGQPSDAPPLGPTGDPISKIRVFPAKASPVAVSVRHGSADRGEIVRTDVFQQPNATGVARCFLVPIYRHQVKQEAPPARAIASGAESSWPETGCDHEFLFSLWPMSLIRASKRDGEIIEGYLRSIDRNTGALSLSSHLTLAEIRKGIGVRNLLSLEKLHVDRLGRVSVVGRETRTWRGEAYTSVSPPG